MKPESSQTTSGANRVGSMGGSAVRWAIIGVHGLYVGQELTRHAAIEKHCIDLYGYTVGQQRRAWQRCVRKGDRAIRVRISWPNIADDTRHGGSA